MASLLCPALVLFAARLSGFAVGLLVLFWVLTFKSTFLPSSLSQQDFIYAVLHPLLMVIGFILLSGEAILVHRWLPGSMGLKKSVHLGLQGVALASGIFGIWTKFQGKDGIVANFYSLHSWMGLICISLFGIQSKQSKQSSKSWVKAESRSELEVDPSGIETEVTQPTSPIVPRPVAIPPISVLSPVQPNTSTVASQASTDSPMENFLTISIFHFASYMPLPKPEVVLSVQELEPIVSFREEEVTSLEPQMPPGLDLLVVEMVNIILDYLNHPLEEINNNTDLKVRLFEALGFLDQKIPTRIHTVLGVFIEDIYNYTSKSEIVEEKLRKSIEALANHDAQLKKCKMSKSQIEEVLSEGRAKEQTLWLLGFLNFWHRREAKIARIKILPWHVFLGLYTYALAVATAETGLLEKLAFIQSKRNNVSKHSTESLLVNSLGLFLAMLSGFVILAAVSPKYGYHTLQSRQH
ncbi:hypothetical protein Ahy_A05g022179 isoform A [Arachis hypogaea]|uniref:Cytochrome b561 domain-containing protein n=1 Tax=Arachis hypogaea TaxID=3818 RepID=A0A445CZW8_ARAHY|nr:hypothetical protein Ahy_A05g022179 isoform A [Arachis hypogaea]